MTGWDLVLFGLTCAAVGGTVVSVVLSILEGRAGDRAAEAERLQVKALKEWERAVRRAVPRGE